MSPLSGTVLGAAAVVASPALWATMSGTLPLDVALTRFLIAAVGCWVALSVVVELVAPGGLAAHSEPPDAAEDDAGEQAADQTGVAAEDQAAPRSG